jgi:hypothetical protein
MNDLTARLALDRGIVTPADRMFLLTGQLREDGYTRTQARTAELWILRGDWSSKGQDAILEYSDFYPTEEQLRKKVAGDKIVVMTRAEQAQMCKRWQSIGYWAAKSEQETLTPPSPSWASPTWAKGEPIISPTTELLKAKIARLEREHEEYRQTVNAHFVGMLTDHEFYEEQRREFFTSNTRIQHHEHDNYESPAKEGGDGADGLSGS